MINDYSNRGLRILDIQSFNQALKAKWIQKYLDHKTKRKWKSFLSDIRAVDHLLDKHSKFFIFNTFKKKYSVKTNFLQYYSVVCAISGLKKKSVLATQRRTLTMTLKI